MSDSQVSGPSSSVRDGRAGLFLRLHPCSKARRGELRSARSNTLSRVLREEVPVHAPLLLMRVTTCCRIRSESAKHRSGPRPSKLPNNLQLRQGDLDGTNLHRNYRETLEATCRNPLALTVGRRSRLELLVPSRRSDGEEIWLDNHSKEKTRDVFSRGYSGQPLQPVLAANSSKGISIQ